MPLKLLRDEEPSINLTPMVDVVFQLILFFLLGTKFTEMERKVDLEVPQVSASAATLTAAPQRQIINVHRDGSLTLDGEAVTPQQLVDQLSAAQSQQGELGVLVRGDAQGQFQRVAEVLTACRQAGIHELGISVMPVAPQRR